MFFAAILQKQTALCILFVFNIVVIHIFKLFSQIYGSLCIIFDSLTRKCTLQNSCSIENETNLVIEFERIQENIWLCECENAGKAFKMKWHYGSIICIVFSIRTLTCTLLELPRSSNWFSVGADNEIYYLSELCSNY